MSDTLFRGLPPPMPPDAFPEIGPLIAAAKADGIDARMVLARVLTDLFVGRMLHTRDELVQFEALVEPLIRIVDTRTAVAVADKLARHAETPRGVIEALLGARGRSELRGAARRGHARSAHARHSGGAGLAPGGGRHRVARRHCRGDCAHPRLSRRSPDRSCACAKAEARSAARCRVASLRQGARQSRARQAYACPAKPRLSRTLRALPRGRAAGTGRDRGRGDAPRLFDEGAPEPLRATRCDEAVLALAGQGKEKLAEALAAWLGLGFDDAQAIVDDPTGEALVLALRACGARPEPIVTLLLRRGLHLSRSVERIFSLERLARETSGGGRRHGRRGLRSGQAAAAAPSGGAAPVRERDFAGSGARSRRARSSGASAAASSFAR